MNDVDPPAEDETAARARLAALREEHQVLDAVVAGMGASPAQDEIALARLKKRKLALRDQITQLENQLTPDIIA